MTEELNKFFSPTTCPSCKNIFYILVRMGNPEIDGTLTLEQVDNFKNLARAMADKITDPEEKQQVLGLIDDPSYIMDQEELDNLSKSL